MGATSQPLRDSARLSAEDWAWLDGVLGDWQILADLSFADLVLWVPDRATSAFWVADQIRPTTGPTALATDLIGSSSHADDIPLVAAAFASGEIAREPSPEELRSPAEAIPVRRSDQVVAVITRHVSARSARGTSPLERAYLQAADDLAQMIAAGLLTGADDVGVYGDTPRVGDGFIRLGADGTIEYASPNAQSAFRRLGFAGDLLGLDLAETTRALVPAESRGDEELLSAVLSGRRSRSVEVASPRATAVVRAIPLTTSAGSAGGLVLVRDVTDLRRRDRELITKDATIREIHHRVKNNLQTVAALLRLQARRIDNSEGRAALEEAIRRVAAIAVVHETLSQSFEEEVAFDEVADQLSRSISDVGGHGQAVTVKRDGSFGTLASEVATPLALVLTELLQNAVEHGYPGDDGGQIVVQVARAGGGVQLSVSNDGVGLPPDFDLEASASLGLSIVGTLVAEMGGVLRIANAKNGGTTAEVELP